ncbi:hypothetical protein QJQ45_021108 [Haematococcus lacustris]|nr:hypothetical protein QJQ45_021108 [Haematococcus lacustris]
MVLAPGAAAAPAAAAPGSLSEAHSKPAAASAATAAARIEGSTPGLGSAATLILEPSALPLQPPQSPAPHPSRPVLPSLGHAMRAVNQQGAGGSMWGETPQGATWVRLTADHRIASSGAERARLAQRGHTVRTRLYGLNISRMLGDRFLKDEDLGFLAEPFVSSVEVVPAGSPPAFLVLASDGLWDVVSEGRVAALLAKAAAKEGNGQLCAQEAADLLLKQAVDGRSKDDISIMVLCLQPGTKNDSFPSRQVTTGASGWLDHAHTSGGAPALCVPAFCLGLSKWQLCLVMQVIKVPEGAVLRGCKKTRRKLREHLRLRAEIHSQLRVIASLLFLRIFLTCLVGYPTPGFPSAPQAPAVQPPSPLMLPPYPPYPHVPLPNCDSEPEPQSDSESESEPEPVRQPHPRRCSARLAALAPAAPTGPPLPLDCEDPAMLRQLKDFCKFFANPNYRTCYNQLQRRLVRHRHPMLMPAFEDPSNQALLAKLHELGSINLAGDANTIDAHSMQLAVAMQQHYSSSSITIGTGGGWGADAVLRACRKVVCRPRGTDQLRGRVVLVDEHRTSRVSSAVNGKQPCEVELNTLSATRPAGWKPPAGQVEPRLVRPACSQEHGQPVRGLMWCPVVAPRKPPQAPRSSQEATHPAASEPGPSTPTPAKRSKRTKAEPAAEPTKGKGKGKAVKAKPAPQPGRWLDRDCNAALNMQRVGENKWRPLELCYWPDQGALPAKGKEYPGLGYKRLRDKPPKAQQQQQQPAEAQ